MPGYEHIRAGDIVWETDYDGVHVARFEHEGMKVAILRGKKGQSVPDHRHTRGSFLWVLSGRVIVDNQELVRGEGGKCNPGTGHYPVQFVEDAEVITFRLSTDEITFVQEAE
jgi:quercetin dioxygenase-like cupin family protein